MAREGDGRAAGAGALGRMTGAGAERMTGAGAERITGAGEGDERKTGAGADGAGRNDGVDCTLGIGR